MDTPKLIIISVQDVQDVLMFVLMMQLDQILKTPICVEEGMEPVERVVLEEVEIEKAAAKKKEVMEEEGAERI